jgi:hypothetical protein
MDVETKDVEGRTRATHKITLGWMSPLPAAIQWKSRWNAPFVHRRHQIASGFLSAAQTVTA